MSQTTTVTTDLSVTLPEASQLITSTWRQPGGHRMVIALLGEPGLGKSASGHRVAADIAPTLGVSPDRVIFANLSHWDTTDMGGIPDLSGDVARWKPPALFYALRAGTGPAILILDEAAGDLTLPMQNLLCRLVYDRCAGELALTDSLYLLLTGNRASDKSGANRLSTKLGNRMLQMTIRFSQTAWEAWAHTHGIGADILAFHRWKADTAPDNLGLTNPEDKAPSTAFGFDPSRSINPTPRAWAEMVNRIDRSLPPSLYLKALAGAVTLGPATEFVAFQQYFKELPPIHVIWQQPDAVPVPTSLQGQYALAIYAASHVDRDTFPALLTLGQRLHKDLSIPLVLAAQQRCPAVTQTAAFSQWAIAHQHLIF